MKLMKTFLKNSSTSERLSSDALLSIEWVRAEKIELDGLIDEFDSRHDKINLEWVDVDMKFWHRLCRD